MAFYISSYAKLLLGLFQSFSLDLFISAVKEKPQIILGSFPIGVCLMESLCLCVNVYLDLYFCLCLSLLLRVASAPAARFQPNLAKEQYSFNN